MLLRSSSRLYRRRRCHGRRLLHPSSSTTLLKRWTLTMYFRRPLPTVLGLKTPLTLRQSLMRTLNVLRATLVDARPVRDTRALLVLSAMGAHQAVYFTGRAVLVRIMD